MKARSFSLTTPTINTSRTANISIPLLHHPHFVSSEVAVSRHHRHHIPSLTTPHRLFAEQGSHLRRGYLQERPAMTFHTSNPHTFGYDMNANHLNYDTLQQSNQHTEYYQDNKPDADQSTNNVPMMRNNSTSHTFRKDSVATNSGALNDASNSWDHKQIYPGPAFDSSHTFRQSNNSGYVQHDHTQVYPHAPQEWMMSPSGSVDTTGFEGYSGAKNENSPFPGSLPREQSAFTPIHSHAFSLPHHVSSPQASLSPPSHPDWMDMTGPNKPLKSADVKPIKPRHQPILRRDHRDGIRKKNAKIPIPSEITLENIDDLIEGCADEDDMKQLKAQKRLLRNREAALASRQRKKKHTENLEQKEKHLETKLISLHTQVEQLRLQLSAAESQKQFVTSEHAKVYADNQTLHMEKEDLICKHTKETANLRGQIRWYREQFEQFDAEGIAPAMSKGPSSSGFTDFNLEMDGLQIGEQPWDKFINVHGSDDTDYLGNTAESFATIQPAKHLDQHQQQDTTAKTEQPVASGILFMLLLCGAFVASRSSSSSTTSTSNNSIIPKMPEEVRAASTEVLNNLLKDNPQEASLFLPDLASSHQAQYTDQTTNTAWPNQHNNMQTLHHHITAPTSLQEAEQAFAMTPAQYASLTNYHAHAPITPLSPSQSLRPNLAEALGKMREARGPSAAEVYTRSLLWEQIPEDVVREFRRAVAARNSGNDDGDEAMGGERR